MKHKSYTIGSGTLVKTAQISNIVLRRNYFMPDGTRARWCAEDPYVITWSTRPPFAQSLEVVRDLDRCDPGARFHDWKEKTDPALGAGQLQLTLGGSQFQLAKDTIDWLRCLSLEEPLGHVYLPGYAWWARTDMGGDEDVIWADALERACQKEGKEMLNGRDREKALKEPTREMAMAFLKERGYGLREALDATRTGPWDGASSGARPRTALIIQAEIDAMEYAIDNLKLELASAAP